MSDAKWLARFQQAPKQEAASYVQTIRLYTCSNCGKQDQWGPTWSVYYEMPKSRNKKYLDPEVKYVACSDRCVEAIDDNEE